MPSALEQDVAGMRVGVVVAVREDLAEERAQQAAGELVALDRDAVDPPRIGERPALDLLHHQDPPVVSVRCTAGIATPTSSSRFARRRIPADASRWKSSSASMLWISSSASSRAPIAAGGLDPAFERPGDEAQHRPVALDHLLHARPLDLDHHRVAAAQLRSVGLPDRRGRERLGVELVERLVDRLAELGLEHLLDLVRRHALDVGVQVRELVGDRRGQQVGAGGGDLAELHEHPARALEHDPQPARKIGGVERRDRAVTDVDEVLLAGVADQLAKATDGREHAP